MWTPTSYVDSAQMVRRGLDATCELPTAPAAFYMRERPPAGPRARYSPRSDSPFEQVKVVGGRGLRLKRNGRGVVPGGNLEVERQARPVAGGRHSANRCAAEIGDKECCSGVCTRARVGLDPGMQCVAPGC